MSFNITAVSGPDFVNRKEEMREFMSELGDMKSTNGFALYGRRRLGKSSILKELKLRLQKDPRIKPIYFSLWDLTVKDLQYFCKLMTRRVLEQYRKDLKIKYKIKDVYETSMSMLKQIISEIHFKVPGLDDSIEFLLMLGREKEYDADRLIEETFSLPDRLAMETGKKSVLFIDEFPDVMELKIGNEKIGIGIVGKIRGLCEDFTRTSLSISGSIRKTMELSVLSESSAFYKQLFVKEILPFSKKAVEMLLNKNLPNKKISSDAMQLIFEKTSGTPLYVNYLGRIFKVMDKKRIDAEDVDQAIKTFLSQDAKVLFNEDLSALSDKERLIVIEMAVKGMYQHSKIESLLSNQISNVGMYMSSLEQKGLLRRVSRGHYAFEDSMFEKWLRETYSEEF